MLLPPIHINWFIDFILHYFKQIICILQSLNRNDFSNNRKFLINSSFIVNFTLSRTPFFELKGLEPGIGYDMLVIAENKKGKSRPSMLHGYTLKTPEKQTGLYTYLIVVLIQGCTWHLLLIFLYSSVISFHSCFPILRHSHFTRPSANIFTNKAISRHNAWHFWCSRVDTISNYFSCTFKRLKSSW